MHLNKQNGNLNFREFAITSNTLLSDVANLARLYDVQPGNRNGDYTSYNVRDIDDGDITLGIRFFKENLFAVGISLGRKYNFPPFENTEEEKHVLKARFELLGGEKKYDWGEVTFGEDPRGGSLYIYIGYNT